MSNLVTAKILYQQGAYYGGCNRVIPINCNKLAAGTPVEAWLVRKPPCCGVTDFSYEPVFEDPLDNNALKGVWIAVADDAVFVDGTVEDVVAKCNGCCGDEAEVTPIIGSNVPEFDEPVLATYTITRTDNGDVVALNKAARTYYGDYKEGTFSRTAYSGGVSTYSFQASTDPVPRGTDTLASETGRVFDSNTIATTPGSGNHYKLTVEVAGDIVTDVESATLAGIVTAANAADALGTYTLVTDKIRLTSTTVDAANLVIVIEAD